MAFMVYERIVFHPLYPLNWMMINPHHKNDGGSYPIGSMGLVVGKYTSPMDPSWVLLRKTTSRFFFRSEVLQSSKGMGDFTLSWQAGIGTEVQNCKVEFLYLKICSFMLCTMQN